MVGYVKNGDELAYRAEASALVEWCSSNSLVLNLAKTKEIIFDFRKNTTAPPPLVICNQTVDRVDSFKILGTWTWV